MKTREYLNPTGLFIVVYIVAKLLIWNEAESYRVVRDQFLVSITTRQCTFEKQQGLYHNKVSLSLTPVKRLGNQARNCKMDYSMKCMNSVVSSIVKSKVTNFVFQANKVRSMQVPYMSWVFGKRKYISVRSCSNVLNEPCCKWSRDKQSQWFDVHYCILLITSNFDLAINQLKSIIIFLYFRHEPINKFNVTLPSRHSPPPLDLTLVEVNVEHDKSTFWKHNWNTNLKVKCHLYSLILV